ncbi:MAG: hypothetical protein GY756_23305 [bacterium]|nr:hypothetical protein [bacterium]
MCRIIKSDSIKIFGKSYDRNIDSIIPGKISFMEDLIHLKEFPNLRYAGFWDSNINDIGVKYLSDCTSIDNLNLQFTEITDKGIEYLSNMKNLKFLRLKECDCITNNCIWHINKLINLEDLQIHGTDIDEEGLQNLVLPNLKYLLIEIWENNFSYDFLISLSKRLGNCEIAVNKGIFQNGKFDGEWD